MPFNRIHARSLCNASEFDLFESSLAGEVEEIAKSRLQGKVERARRLRDKYRDLYRRQRVAARARTGTKHGRSGDANLRTKQKAKLFDEVLVRLQSRLKKLERAEKSGAAGVLAKALKRKKKAADRKLAPKKSASRKPSRAKTPKVRKFSSRKAQSANRKRQLQKSGTKRIQAHVRSSGRRMQAKRDRR
ncbi:MAG TPA: hypothetical protein VMP00_08460 [Burkholderiales bacterium]|nr:hypothetical protein [Burkholderiales bacterium]